MVDPIAELVEADPPERVGDDEAYARGEQLQSLEGRVVGELVVATAEEQHGQRQERGQDQPLLAEARDEHEREDGGDHESATWR